MGEKVVLEVKLRKVVGKKVSKLRQQGLVPGVVYGEKVKSQPVEAGEMEVARVWKAAGKRQPIELDLDGARHLVMIKTVDIDPVKHKIRNLGLHVVNKNEKVEAEVPVKVRLAEGNEETPAERAGLVVLMAIEKVEVEALPNDLPEAVFFDGEKLTEEGQHATVADILPTKGVAILTEPEITIATVYEPAALAAQNEATGGQAEEVSEVTAENGAPAEAAEADAKGKDESKKEQ